MRRAECEVTDIGEILGIVSRAKILRLGLFDEEFPYVVPLHYGYEYQDGTLIFYMHSAKEGHKLDLLKKNPRVCVELDCDILFDSGGEVPCRCGAHSEFSSVIGRGFAEIVSDEREKIRGLERLMSTQTGRSYAIDAQMAATVAVIKVTVKDFTAKAKRHGAKHAPKNAPEQSPDA